ncbi:MAG: hypothetical protein AAGD88_00890 [Bacteroidota bacterium]
MIKSITFPLIALLLISSILAPSLLSILDIEKDLVVLVDTSEEEKNTEKESEKKSDESDLFFNTLGHTAAFSELNPIFKMQYAFDLGLDFIGEVNVPPPRSFT